MRPIVGFQLSNYQPPLHLFKNQIMLLNTENEAFRPELIVKGSPELNVLNPEWTFNSGKWLQVPEWAEALGASSLGASGVQCRKRYSSRTPSGNAKRPSRILIASFLEKKKLLPFNASRNLFLGSYSATEYLGLLNCHTYAYGRIN